MRARWRASGRAGGSLVLVGLLCAVALASCALSPFTSGARTPAAPLVAGGRTAPAVRAAAPPLVANRMPASAPSLTAAAAYLYDPATDQVLYAHNATQERAMASTTKIMTAYVALQYSSPARRIVVGADAVALENGIASVAGLQLGDNLSLEELLYCLMLPSGDDAAVAIADGVAGSQARFVGLMNLEAALLGLGETHYVDVHGLDAPGHYSSAHDLAVLTAIAMGDPLFRQIVATPQYVIPANSRHAAYDLQNLNELLSTRAYPGALGVKTGYTGNAGYCLVFAAQRNGHELIGVVLGEPTYESRFTDATALLGWGFAALAAPTTAGATATATASASASGG